MKTKKNKSIKNILVVGGGIGGLETVRQLQLLSTKLNKPFRITLLEKEARFGGRIKTIRTSPTTFYEGGASRIACSHQNVEKLIQLFHLKKKKCSNGESSENSRKPLCNLFEKIKDTFLEKYDSHMLKQLTWYDILKESCETEKEATDLVLKWGFTSIVLKLNAYDFWNVIHNYCVTKYYTLEGGLQSLPDALVAHVQQNTNLITHTNSILNSIQLNTNTPKKHRAVWSKGGNHTYTQDFDAIFLALPSKALKSIIGLPTEISSKLSYVTINPALHVYAKTHAKISCKEKTLDTVLRRARPSHDPEWNQISYTDNDAARYLHKMMKSPYHTYFLEKKSKLKIPNWKQNIDYYYWKEATHSWRPNHSSAENYDKILQFNRKIPFFIVGSCFSKSQAWIEGALETVNDSITLLEHYWKTYGRNG